MNSYSITRYLNETGDIVDGTIEKDEWVEYLDDSDIVNVDDRTREGKNPITGKQLIIPPQPDVGWFEADGVRIEIQYNDGDLWTECESSGAVVKKLMELAADLDAVLVDEENQVIG